MCLSLCVCVGGGGGGLQSRHQPVLLCNVSRVVPHSLFFTHLRFLASLAQLLTPHARKLTDTSLLVTSVPRERKGRATVYDVANCSGVAPRLAIAVRS